MHTPRFLSLRRTGTAPDCTRVQPSIPCHLYLECRRPTAVHRDGLRSTSAYRFHEARGATLSPPLPKQLKLTTGRHHLPHTYTRQCNPHTILPLPGGITCRIHVHISATPIPYFPYQAASPAAYMCTSVQPPYHIPLTWSAAALPRLTAVAYALP